MVKEQTVDKQANVQATPNLTPAQEALQAVWEEHIGHEFGTHSPEDALATMVEDAYVNHIPVMTGGVGKPAEQAFHQYLNCDRRSKCFSAIDWNDIETDLRSRLVRWVQK